MEFITRSIYHRAVAGMSLALLIGALAAIILNKLGYTSTLFIAAPFLVLIIVVVVMLYTLLHAPLKKIFTQIRALLTGHPYKKIFTSRIDEIGVLAHFFNEVTKSFERLSVDAEEGKRMSKELSVGSDIQKKILPVNMPSLPGVDLFGKTRPASEVGGDSFDVIETPSKNTFIYVGDVTGHGLPAGLIMVMVNTLIRTLSEFLTSGYDVMVQTNRILKQRIEQRRFMTAVLLRWNGNEQKLYYTGCGHEHIVIYRANQHICEVRKTGGIALGMVPDISRIIKEEQVELATGDSIVLYSDGIVEAKNMSGEMFGVERLKQSVERYAGTCTSEELFTNISKDFGLFVGEQTQNDDITLIVLKKT
ncbi:serine/threonine-protein phosphatase [Candidatus Gracilibacteria bacterium]|nr:serine/threonine-protein phosphatase [Candidatus Gracilibacteria bacterium]